MNAVRSYCCASVPSAYAAASKRIFSCWMPFCFFGLGIGVMKTTLRRSGRILFVGWPLASSSQWRDGYSYGEFRIGCSKNAAVVAMAGRSLAHAAGIPCNGGHGGMAAGTEAS